MSMRDPIMTDRPYRPALSRPGMYGGEYAIVGPDGSESERSFDAGTADYICWLLNDAHEAAIEQAGRERAEDVDSFGYVD